MVTEAHTLGVDPPIAGPSIQTIARQAVSGLSWTGVSLLTTFALKTLLTHRMEPREMGLVVAAQSFAVLALAVAELGIPDALVRFVGIEAARDRTPRRTMQAAVKIVGVATLAATLLGIVALWTWMRSGMAADALWATTLAVLSLPLLGIGNVIGAAHRGAHRLGTKIILADITRPAVVGIGLLLSPVVLTRQAPYVAGLYVAAALISLAGLWVMFVRDRRWQDAGTATSRDLLTFGVPLVGAAVLAGPLVNSGLPLMLSTWAGPVSVTYFTLALSLQTLVYLPIGVFEQAVVPAWSRMVSAGSRHELVVSFQQYTNVCFAGATCLGLLIIANDAAILSFLFGPTYQAAGPALKGTIAATLWGALTGPNEAMLKAFGRTVAIFKARMAAAVASVAVGVLCIPSLGLMGGVAAFAAATVTINTLYAIMLYMSAGIHPFTWRHALTTVIAVAGVGVNATMAAGHPEAAFIAVMALAAIVLVVNADLWSAIRTLVAH